MPPKKKDDRKDHGDPRVPAGNALGCPRMTERLLEDDKPRHGSQKPRHSCVDEKR